VIIKKIILREKELKAEAPKFLQTSLQDDLSSPIILEQSWQKAPQDFSDD
jgi:hypothetical protein